MKDFLFGGARINTVLGNVGLLGLRGFAGLSLALAHGWAKVPPPAQFVTGVSDLGLPGELAWLTAAAEFGGGLLLAAGLLTRPAALAMMVNFSVAGFMRHAADPYARAELAFLFLAVAFLFVCVGGGRFALDRLIRK